MAKRRGLNVIVPLGGAGQRFRGAGYVRPKPLVNVGGVPMLARLLAHLSLAAQDDLLIVYNPHPPHGVPCGYEQALRDALTSLRAHQGGTAAALPQVRGGNG